jgi:hypothetical protein
MIKTAAQTTYQQRSGVLVQRDLTLAAYHDVPAALQDPDYGRPSPEETVMIIARHGQRYELNLVAACIWERVDGTRSCAAIVADVVHLFDVDDARARSDIIRLLGQFVEYGLIESREQSYTR